MLKTLSANKTFWKTIKSFLADMSLNPKTITLTEKKFRKVNGDAEILNIMNSRFTEIIERFNLKSDVINQSQPQILSTLSSTMKLFRGFSQLTTTIIFSFGSSMEEEFKKKILNLSSKKTSNIGVILIQKHLKANTNIYLKHFTILINDFL